MGSLFQELKRRKVFRVAAVYTVVAWLLIQIADTVMPALQMPDWTVSFVTLLLILGFPISIILAWAFDVTPDGVARTVTEGHEAPASTATFGRYVLTAFGAGVFGATAVWYFTRDLDTRWLNEVALPQIESYLALGDWQNAFTSAVEADARVPGAPELEEFWPRMSWTTTIQSDPSGAMVFRRPYGGSEESWQAVGHTPLEDVRVPFGVSEIRFDLEGFVPFQSTIGHGMVNFPLRDVTVPLEPENEARDGKVLVSGFTLAVGDNTVDAGDFYLGRYEVTNDEFKNFVDAGGYERPSLWEPFVEGGQELSWDDGISRLVDATGQPGPSGWEAGDYPPGEANHAVEGVSWYEAMAYARWVGEELPTAEHLRRTLSENNLHWLLGESNFDGTGTRPVLESRAISYTGAYDLAGNVREWTSTPIGNDYVILGGSWIDPYYVVGVGNTSAPPMNRIAGNGFRLAITSDEPSVETVVRSVVPPAGLGRHAVPDREPVSLEVFQAFANFFEYERGLLNDELEQRVESRNWVHEVITFDAGYRGERVRLHLYLPTVGSPPFQTVIYWPGWDTFSGNVPVEEYFSEQADYIVQRGRALAFPVYNGTFERRDSGRIPDFGSTAYRDNTLDTVKDLRRSLDYLETRPEIDTRSFAYYGYSWGGVTAPIVLAHEDRLKAAIVHIGGSPDLAATPEVDPVNALPRVQVPVLLLSGEFDSIMPIENARHYFELLGSTNKEHIVTQGAHFIPRIVLVRESLEWLDLHLGEPR